MNDKAPIAVVREPAELDNVPSTEEQLKLIRNVAGGGQLTDQEFALFLEIARRHRLDPLKRQIHAAKFGGKMTVMVGIDGFRGRAQELGLAGQDDAVHTYHPDDKNQAWPMTSTITIYRRDRLSGEKDAYTATARWKEYAKLSNGKPLEQWAIRPHVMLDKCAEALAIRKGFSELAGLYTAEEFDRQTPPSKPAQVKQTRKLDELPAADKPIDTTARSDEPPDGEGYFPGDEDAP